MIRKINRFFYRSLYWTTAFTAISFFLMVCINVFTRYVLKSPVIASIELSRIFFVWSCFLAAALTYMNKGHIVISFVFDQLPPAVRKFIAIITHILSVLFFILITVWSAETVILIWNTEFPILGISQSWLYLPVPVVSALMLFVSLEFLLANLQNKSVIS